MKVSKVLLQAFATAAQRHSDNLCVMASTLFLTMFRCRSGKTMFVWCALAIMALPLYGQTAIKPDDPTVRVTTELVIVDTQVVRQRDGQLVGGLAEADFIVEEDGEPQTLTFFSQNKLPLSVVLLIDLTDTVQPVLQALAQGALSALQHFKPEDELAVLAYSNKTMLMEDFTRDRQAVAAAIQNAATLNAPAQLALFNEAVWQAAAHLQKHAAPGTRRVILWLTDNLPNNPPKHVHTEVEAFEQLLENDIATFCLMKQSAEGKLLNFTTMFMKNPGSVFKYAEQTGGEVMKIEQSNAAQQMAELIDHMRARYALGYVSTNTDKPPGFRRIRVRLAPGVEKRLGNKVTLRGKAGYFAKTK